jgi:type IV pilus assembly protein PilV
MDPLHEDQHRGYVDHDEIFDANNTGLAGAVHMKFLHTTPAQQGFTLVEVMVALVVISAGLLGVAKMQALALSSTNVASVRALAAIEAASLAATMHENRAYWTSGSPAANPNGKIVITSTGPKATPTITADASLTGTVDCTSGSGHAVPYCDSTAPASLLAGYDLQQWAGDLNAVMPNYTATITCSGSPVSCTIAIQWTERAVALNSQEAAAQAAAGNTYLQAPTAYTLFVEP